MKHLACGCSLRSCVSFGGDQPLFALQVSISLLSESTHGQRAWQVEQLEKTAADSAQAVRCSEAARVKAQADVARTEGILQELRSQLDSATRHVQGEVES